MIVACYGFPVSHPQRGTNEVLLSDALAYLSSLTCPSFLAGDLNDSVHTSPILSMASAIGVHDLTPNLPTTMKKDGQIANAPPLDHVMANRSALDSAPKVRIDYRILLSDHFPLSLTLNLQTSSTSQIAWPAATSADLNVTAPIVWEYTSYTYQEWQANACAWIEQATQCKLLAKDVWTKKEKVHSGPKKNLNVRRLLKLQSALSEVVLHASTRPKVDAIRRKVLALKWRPWRSLLHDLNTLHVQVKEELERVIQRQHETLISKWKEVARGWNSSSSKVFAYLRNPLPQKSVAIHHLGAVQSDPLKVQDALFSYWAELENWSGSQLKSCLEVLEDKYSFLLPHYEYQAYVQPSDLMDVAKSTRASSPGVDGWTHKELAILPVHAWLDLMMVCSWNPASTMIVLRQLDKCLQKGAYQQGGHWRPYPSSDQTYRCLQSHS